MPVPHCFHEFFDRLGPDNYFELAENTWSARCPYHDDRHHSLSVTVGHTGNLVLNCHGPSKCTAKQIIGILGLTMQHLFSDGKRDYRSERKIERRYPYHYVDGAFAYECVRWVPKDFSYRRFNPDYPKGSNSKYIWSIEGIERVLYRLPELLKSIKENPKREVFLGEGEKDCDNMRKHGLIATTAPFGAKNWFPHYNEYFRGARVNIIYDLDRYDHRSQDRPGYAHALKVAQQLYGVAELVRVVRLPFAYSETEKYDFTDWLEGLPPGVDVKRAVWELTKNIPPYYPGWEYDSDFQRLQSAALVQFERGEAFDMNRWREIVEVELNGFFNGMDLTRMVPDAAKLCASVQYLCEHLHKLHGIRADPHERPSTARGGPPVSAALDPEPVRPVEEVVEEDEETKLLRELGVIP